MEIYLVRHTETLCEKGICYGQSDVGIRAPYEAIFESIRQQLPNKAVLYSSPLQRCLVLAQHIQNNSDTDFLTEDHRLMEMHFGDWELQSWDAIPRGELDPWMEDFVNRSTPNGESFVDLHQRVTAFLDEVLAVTGPVPIVIVAHSGVIRSLLCTLENRQLKDAFVDQIDFGAVLKLEI